MERDTMLQNSNIKHEELNQLINALGMNNEDMNDIIRDNSIIKNQNYLSMGPKPYWCGYYGTISIEDF
jgi:hypothetical protein